MTESAKGSIVVCIGVATRDVIAVASDPVYPDGRILASEMLDAGGGPAATAAVTLARLGVKTSFIGRIGADLMGTLICDGLQRTGVDVAGLRLEPGGRSPASVVVVNPVTAQRSIVTFPGEAYKIELDEGELDACRNAQWIHVDQAGYNALAQIRKAGITTPVSLDAGNPIPGLDLSLIDLYAPTQTSICRAMGYVEVEPAMKRALHLGPTIVAVTNGSNGSIAGASVNGEIKFFLAPPFRIPSLASTLGAGDVFHGALLAGLIYGMELPAALQYANAAAALSCRGVDGRTAIPNRSELDAFIAASAFD